MKTLFLIRHAKSSWDEPVDDFDRGLNGRGKENAKSMGQRLRGLGIEPDIVYSSPAKRAKATAKLLCGELGCEDKITYVDELYEAPPSTILNVIGKAPKQADTLFVICHNPGLNELASELVDFEGNLPTTGVVQIKLDIQKWEQASGAKAELKSFYTPKDAS